MLLTEEVATISQSVLLHGLFGKSLGNPHRFQLTSPRINGKFFWRTELKMSQTGASAKFPSWPHHMFKLTTSVWLQARSQIWWYDHKQDHQSLFCDQERLWITLLLDQVVCYGQCPKQKSISKARLRSRFLPDFFLQVSPWLPIWALNSSSRTVTQSHTVKFQAIFVVTKMQFFFFFLRWARSSAGMEH